MAREKRRETLKQRAESSFSPMRTGTRVGFRHASSRVKERGPSREPPASDASRREKRPPGEGHRPWRFSRCEAQISWRWPNAVPPSISAPLTKLPPRASVSTPHMVACSLHSPRHGDGCGLHGTPSSGTASAGRCRLERSKGGCLPLRVRELTRAALPETRDGKPQEQSSSRASGGRARGEFSRSATSLRGPSGAAIRHRGSEVLSPQGHANLGRSTHANVGVQRPGG